MEWVLADGAAQFLRVSARRWKKGIKTHGIEKAEPPLLRICDHLSLVPVSIVVLLCRSSMFITVVAQLMKTSIPHQRES
jgi:hypothetical protein